MSPLSAFLIFLVLTTILMLLYLSKQFKQENLTTTTSQMNNSKKNSTTNFKFLEKEKVVAETLNGRFAMIGLIAAIGAYLTTGQIIPGFV